MRVGRGTGRLAGVNSSGEQSERRRNFVLRPRSCGGGESHPLGPSLVRTMGVLDLHGFAGICWILLYRDPLPLVFERSDRS